MKKKVLLSSILTMVVCLCLIAGSTFALFTDTVENKIAVTSANVEISADLDITLYSVRAFVEGEDSENEAIVYDPTADTGIEGLTKKYIYEELTGSQFTNGGEMTGSLPEITLTNITPGDKIEFDITGTNASTAAIKVRYVIDYIEPTKGDSESDEEFAKREAAAKKLMAALRFTVEDKSTDVVTEATTQTLTGLSYYASDWQTVAPTVTTLEKKHVVVEFPVELGNEYQNLTTSFRVVVEAVQDNGAEDTNTYTLVNF